MEIIKEIINNTLIVCPIDYKNEILLLLCNDSNLYNIKFMDINEYKRNYYFSYNEQTIYYLCNKYNLKVENAVEILDNLYYVDNKKYKSDKLNYLVNIKLELDNNNLLEYNYNFKNYLNKVDTIVYGYGKLDKFNQNMLSNAKIINYINQEHEILLYHFSDIKMEIEFVFNKILDLLNDGIDINKIYLMNVDDNYFPYLKMFSNLYQIPINIPNKDKIIGTKIINYFISLIKSHKSRNEIYELMDIYKNNTLYDKVIDIINKYVLFDNLYEVIDLIKYDLNNINVGDIIYENAINIKEINTLVDDSEYIFLMNFNESIPKSYKDISYINDSIKNEINYSSVDELNKISKENTINNLYGIKNLIITYKDKSPFNNYYPSNLLEDIKVISQKYTFNYNYSDNYNKIKYARLLDEYLKYGNYQSDLEELYQTYGNVNYLSYDNKYVKISQNSLLEYINNKLILSYSSIDNYYKCSFKYYLSNILHIDEYEETFYTNIGNLFHEVLSHYRDINFNIDYYYNRFIKSKSFTNKELFFLNKLKDDLIFIIDTIKENNLLTGFNKELYEQKISIILNQKPYVEFKGFIDKIMYRENDNTLVSIIDYKTGNININLDDIKDGLSLQLPVYLYLVKNANMFSNINFVGFYLQHVLNNEIKIDKKKSYLELKKDNLKLIGYTIDDIDNIKLFDSSYENSKMIKGLKLNKDQTISKNSNTLNETDINNIISLCDSKIKEAMNGILSGSFNINPKIKKCINMSCQYCKFKDICYKRDKDYVYLESGDTNA